MKEHCTRRRASVAAALALTLSLAPPAFAADLPAAELIRDDFRFAAAQYERLLERVANDPLLPRSFAGGRVVTVEPRDWTSGFFPGSLWLLYEQSRDEKWKQAAERYTARLSSVKDYGGTHDLGFMLFCSYGNGLRLGGPPAYREVLLQGARTLSGRFDERVGAIKSWDKSAWDYPVIIDNMMNLELLLWAAKNGGDSRLREIAIRHADTTRREHYRPDASSYHVVAFDPATGAVQKKQTHQGAADDSAWARGQSWGLYGYVMMYRETRDAAYLEHARKIARFLIGNKHLPEDRVPYWDYDAPGIPNAPRDSSAAAIMASALLELGDFVEKDERTLYKDVAERQLRALSSPRYRAALGENGGFLLMHAVGHHPKASEVDQPLVYGDYYFLEALLRWKSRL